MRQSNKRVMLSALLVTSCGLLVGCPATGPTSPPPSDLPQPSDKALPDFSLTDVNTASARYMEPVSPRDYLGEVSAWYFGSAT